MKLLIFLSDAAMPLVIIYVIAYGYLNKTDIYEAFIEGAKEGVMTVFKILPTLIGLMVAVGIFSGSGALKAIAGFFTPLTDLIGFPSQAIPLSFMRLVSSSASVGLILDIFKNNGPDSFIGRFVSIMMCCTETVFYTMSVYFMSIGITKTRHTLSIAVFINVFGAVVSFLVAKWFFGY